MIKAKLTAVAVVGIALAGLGGPERVGPAPAFAQDRQAQCMSVLEPALQASEAALTEGLTMDQPGVDYARLCASMKKHEAALADHGRNLTVCEGLSLGGQDQATLEGLLREVKQSRTAIGEARAAVCEAADLNP